jgi:hypothetical protein
MTFRCFNKSLSQLEVKKDFLLNSVVLIPGVLMHFSTFAKQSLTEKGLRGRRSSSLSSQHLLHQQQQRLLPHENIKTSRNKAPHKMILNLEDSSRNRLFLFKLITFSYRCLIILFVFQSVFDVLSIKSVRFALKRLENNQN